MRILIAAMLLIVNVLWPSQLTESYYNEPQRQPQNYIMVVELSDCWEVYELVAPNEIKKLIFPKEAQP